MRVNPLPPIQQDYEVKTISVHTILKTVPPTATILQEFKHSTQNGSTLTKLKHTVHTGWPESPKDCDPKLKDYVSIVKKLALRMEFYSRATE